MSKNVSQIPHYQPMEENTEEDAIGLAWNNRAEVLRARRMAAAKRRLDEIIGH
jgi:hypothetical protein